MTLEWRDLTYKVTTGKRRKKTDKTILRDLTSAVPAGRLLAVMGELALEYSARPIHAPTATASGFGAHGGPSLPERSYSEEISSSPAWMVRDSVFTSQHGVTCLLQQPAYLAC